MITEPRANARRRSGVVEPRVLEGVVTSREVASVGAILKRLQGG